MIFTSKKIEGVSDCIIIPYVDGALDTENADQITNDTFYFNKYIDVVELFIKISG